MFLSLFIFHVGYIKSRKQMVKSIVHKTISIILLPEDIVVHHLLPFLNQEEFVRLFIHDVITEQSLSKALKKTPQEIMEHYETLGKAKTVRNLYFKGFPLTKSLCAIAAKRGSKEQLLWLRTNKCPWDDTTFTAAVLANNLRLMKWLASVRCPMSVHTLREAEKMGKYVSWLVQNGCPIGDYVYDCGRLMTKEGYRKKCEREMEERANNHDIFNYRLVQGR
jgi:hypothetical protein